MMNPQPPSDPAGGNGPAADTLAMLECLRSAVAETLERKRRLGHYFVQWSPEGPRFSGPDAPEKAQPPAQT